MITLLIGIQTACVITCSTIVGCKLINESLKNKPKLKLINKQGKFKHYRVEGR